MWESSNRRTRAGIASLWLVVASCSTAPETTKATETTARETGSIAGTVRDELGEPIDAKVAVVRGSGSHSAWTGPSGAFRFDTLDDVEYVVTAATSEGRFAFVTGVRPGDAFELPAPGPGAVLNVELVGRPAARLGVSYDGARVNDFTLRAGEPMRVVLPSGEVKLNLYGQGVDEERLLELAQGESTDVQFVVGR